MPPTPKRILQREQMLVRVTVEHPECTAACSVQPTFLSPCVPVSLVCPPHGITASGYSCDCASFPGQPAGGRVTFQEVCDSKPVTLCRGEQLPQLNHLLTEGSD